MEWFRDCGGDLRFVCVGEFSLQEKSQPSDGYYYAFTYTLGRPYRPVRNCSFSVLAGLVVFCFDGELFLGGGAALVMPLLVLLVVAFVGRPDNNEHHQTKI